MTLTKKNKNKDWLIDWLIDCVLINLIKKFSIFIQSDKQKKKHTSTDENNYPDYLCVCDGHLDDDINLFSSMKLHPFWWFVITNMTTSREGKKRCFQTNKQTRRKQHGSENSNKFYFQIEKQMTNHQHIEFWNPKKLKTK